MGENELILQQLDNLDLETNPQFKQSIQIFDNPHKGTPKDLEVLLKGSQEPASAAVLFELLQKNINKWLKALKAIGDTHGSVLINTLTYVSDGRDHWVSQVLNNIKTLLKTSIIDQNKSVDDNQDPNGFVAFYLLIYISLISEFNIFFPNHLPILLGYLVPSLEGSDIQASVLLITVKTIEKHQIETFESINNFFDFLLETETNFSNFLNLIKSLELLFPICPAICTKIYTSDSCKEVITEHVKRIGGVNSLSDSTNQLITKNLLKLVSSSCISDECRKFNGNNYLNLLKVGTHLELKGFPELKILSTLCTIKLWNFLQLKEDSTFQLTMNDLYDININFLVNNKQECFDQNQTLLEYAIESLAYLTLNPNLRNHLRNNQTAIESLLNLIIEKSNADNKLELTSSHSSIVYGLLLILTNLMQIKENQGESQESKTINYLKLVATPKASNDTTKENPDEIHNFNKSMIVDHNLLSLISKLKIIKVSKQNNNQNSAKFILIIYYASINKQKQVRQELVKQGGLNILLDHLILVSQVNLKLDGQTRPISNSPELIETRLQAIRALAKILILVNPALVFNKYNVTTCIPFLVELLGPDITNYSGELTNKNATDSYLYNDITNLDKYESLLALTNISSLPDDKNEVKNTVISKTFEKYLNNFIIDSDIPAVQKSSWELITNLIMKPNMLVKFFNTEDKQSMKRLDILIKLLELTDLSLQIILAGLLANATSEFDMIAQILVENDQLRNELIPLLSRIFSNQSTDNDLILRLSFLLLDLVYAAANVSADLLKTIKSDKHLKKSLSVVIQTNKDKQILEVVIEVIKFVQFE